MSLNLLGYRNEGTRGNLDAKTLNKKQLRLLFHQASKNLRIEAISPFVNFLNFKSTIGVATSGYPKLEIPAKKYAASKPNGTIVYAPTPNDLTGNKSAELWLKAITLNEYGVDTMVALLKGFPEKKIVFKPYKGELPNVVTKIHEACSSFANYEFDNSGSEYWDLYSQADLLVSDFSVQPIHLLLDWVGQ